ncbi:hypothetical protein AAFJ72_21205 [Brevibacillus gelatini]|uniref:hypothetical protein n=1 Tax=Brevibacillus gelatini TaxID=1655277 RepID=UPI003D818215
MSDNRIAGYIETPMRISPGEYVVTGSWIASTLSCGKDYIIRHYRNEMLIGTWKINSVINFFTKKGPKIGLRVESDNQFAYFEVGDLLVDQGFDIDFYTISVEHHLNEGSIVGDILGYESTKAIIYSGISGITLAVISQEKVQLKNIVEIKSIRGVTRVQVLGKQGVVDEENPLEVRIDSKPKILLTDFLNTVNPIRAFIVGISKDFNNNYSLKGKFKSPLYEPAVELKAGSIRLLLAPNNEGQLEMFDSPSGLPYVLLYKILASANRDDVQSVIQIISGNFINVQKHMHNLLSIIRPYYKKGLLEVSLRGYETIRINENTYRTVKKAMSLLSSREIEITGQIYAIDTKRKWFRITDNDTDVDWKIIYNHRSETEFDLNILTKGSIRVYASTFSPIEAKRGIAEYINHEFI